MFMTKLFKKTKYTNLTSCVCVCQTEKESEGDGFKTKKNQSLINLPIETGTFPTPKFFFKQFITYYRIKNIFFNLFHI